MKSDGFSLVGCDDREIEHQVLCWSSYFLVSTMKFSLSSSSFFIFFRLRAWIVNSVVVGVVVGVSLFFFDKNWDPLGMLLFWELDVWVSYQPWPSTGQGKENVRAKHWFDFCIYKHFWLVPENLVLFWVSIWKVKAFCLRITIQLATTTNHTFKHIQGCFPHQKFRIIMNTRVWKNRIRK